VTEFIKEILKPDFIDYGYDKTAHLLKKNFIINRKRKLLWLIDC